MADSSAGSPEVKVWFAVEVESGVFVIEPDPDELSVPVREYHRLRGCLRIRSGKDPVVAPEDELVSLVSNVCFGSIGSLLASEHVAIHYTDTYGYLRMDLEGDTVRLSGDRVPDVRVDARSLLGNLLACGSRFLRWLPSCRLEGDIDAMVAALESDEHQARSALAAHRFGRPPTA